MPVRYPRAEARPHAHRGRGRQPGVRSNASRLSGRHCAGRGTMRPSRQGRCSHEATRGYAHRNGHPSRHWSGGLDGPGAPGRGQGDRSPRPAEARMVPGPEVRADDALGPLQPVGRGRILEHLLRGRALVPPQHPRLRRVQAPLRGPAQDLQPGQVRPGRLGQGGQGRPACATSSTPPSTTTASACSTPSRRTTGSPARTCPFAKDPRANIVKEIFDAFRGRGLRDRGLLLQARLALARLLGARLGDARPQRELRHRPSIPSAGRSSRTSPTTRSRS